jgi:hypothetical protein
MWERITALTLSRLQKYHNPRKVTNLCIILVSLSLFLTWLTYHTSSSVTGGDYIALGREHPCSMLLFVFKRRRRVVSNPHDHPNLQ